MIESVAEAQVRLNPALALGSLPFGYFVLRELPSGDKVPNRNPDHGQGSSGRCGDRQDTALYFDCNLYNVKRRGVLVMTGKKREGKTTILGHIGVALG